MTSAETAHLEVPVFKIRRDYVMIITDKPSSDTIPGWQLPGKMTATFLFRMGVHHNHTESFFKIHMWRPLQIKINACLERIYLPLIGMYASES